MNKDEQKKNNGDKDEYFDINGSNDEINIRQNEQKGIFDKCLDWCKKVVSSFAF